MFSDSNEYDFEKQENAAKWKGVFISSLRKVSPRTMLVTLSEKNIFHFPVLVSRPGGLEIWAIEGYHGFAVICNFSIDFLP